MCTDKSKLQLGDCRFSSPANAIGTCEAEGSRRMPSKRTTAEEIQGRRFFKEQAAKPEIGRYARCFGPSGDEFVEYRYVPSGVRFPKLRNHSHA
jgi:hypothetical protein